MTAQVISLASSPSSEYPAGKGEVKVMATRSGLAAVAAAARDATSVARIDRAGE